MWTIKQFAQLRCHRWVCDWNGNAKYEKALRLSITCHLTCMNQKHVTKHADDRHRISSQKEVAGRTSSKPQRLACKQCCSVRFVAAGCAQQLKNLHVHDDDAGGDDEE